MRGVKLRVRRWLDASIGHRFEAVLIAMTLGVLVITVVGNFAYLLHMTRQAAIKALQEHVRDHARELVMVLDGVADHSRIISENPTVVSAVLDNRGQETYLQPLLQRSQRRDLPPRNVCVTDYKGRSLACLHGSKPDYAGEPWLARVMAESVPLARVARRDANQPLLMLVYPVIYEGTGAAEGAVIAEFDLGQLIDKVAGTTGEFQHIHLRDADGDLFQTGSHDISLHFGQDLPLTGPLAALGLRYGLGINTSTFNAPLYKLSAAYGLIALLLLAAALWAVRRAVPPMIARLAALTGEANRLAAGGALTFDTSQAGPDEIGQLARAFATMVRKLRGINASLEDLVALRTAALREQEALLRSILDATPGAIFEFVRAPDGGVSIPFASRAMEDVYGLAPADLREDAAAIFERVHPEDRAAMLASIEESARQLSPWRQEYRVVGSDGAVRWLSGHSLPERRPGGAIVWHGYLADVTEHKQLELEIQHSEARYRELFMANPHPMWVYDVETLAFLAVNAAAIAHYGYSGEEFRRMNIADIRVGDGAGAGPAPAAGEEEGVNLARLCRHRKKDGTVMEVEISSHGLLFDGRRARLVLAHDITARRQAEEALRESEAYNKALFQSSFIALLVMDPETGSFVDCNDAAVRLFGFGGREDLLGRTPIDLSTPTQEDGTPSAEAGRSHLEAACREGAQVFPWRYQHPDGQAWYAEVRLMAFLHQGHQLMQLAVRDITEQKRTEAEIWRRANFDALTGLANRGLLRDRVERAFAHARRHGHRVGLLYLDLDGFKTVNDTLGHAVGDDLLVNTARRLEGCVREQDTVARLGGDEFVLVAYDIDSENDLVRVARMAVDVLAQPFHLAGGSCRISVSAGIAVFPDDAATVDSLLECADHALYYAKRSGKNRYCFYRQP